MILQIMRSGNNTHNHYIDISSDKNWCIIYDDHENDDYNDDRVLSINAPDTFQWQLREDIQPFPTAWLQATSIRKDVHNWERESEWGQLRQEKDLQLGGTPCCPQPTCIKSYKTSWAKGRGRSKLPLCEIGRWEKACQYCEQGVHYPVSHPRNSCGQDESTVQ